MAEQKISKAVDKLVMGMIIGGAVGSVLGMAIAPKSGKENRKMMKEKAEEIKSRAEEIGQQFMQDHGKEINEAKHTLKNKSKSLFSFVKKQLKLKRQK